VPATVILDDRDGLDIREVGIKKLQVGPFEDGERAALTYRWIGEKSDRHQDFHWRNGRGPRVAVLRGHRLGLCEMGEWGRPQSGQNLTLAKVMPRVRTCKAEVIFDRLSSEDRVTNGNFTPEMVVALL
jgi:hypothetical protein